MSIVYVKKFLRTCLVPNNSRLVWDRLPITLACAGLLAAVRADTVPNASGRIDALLLAFFAVVSVAWWRWRGDLRPYLLLQVLPLILIPMWQVIYHASSPDVVSGHTLKHLLATAAASAVVMRLRQRIQSPLSLL